MADDSTRPGTDPLRVRDAGRPADTVRVVSILFADLVGSTRLLNALDPEDARDVLDAALQVVKDGIHAFGGAVARVQGDGIMAVFGMMPAIEDHALRASLAALRIRDGMRAQPGTILPAPQVRVGIHCGTILLRWQDNDFGGMLDVVGQAAHVAGRVEQLCPPGSVAISETALALLDERSDTRLLGEVALDATTSVPAYELEAVHLSSADLMPVKGKTTYPLVGRDAALTALRRVVRAAARARADANDPALRLGLVADAGMGKSRLLNEAAQLARQAGLRYLAIRGSALQQDVPLGAFLPPFRYLAARLGDVAAVADAAGLGAIERECLAGLIETGVPASGALPPDERSRLVRTTIAAVLRHALAEEPHVMLVDDVHHLDIETAALLRDLVAGGLVPGIALVLAGRPEAADTLSGIAATTMRLDPLNEAETRRLAHAILGTAADAAAAAARIAARAGGLPLAIEEFAELAATRPAALDEYADAGTDGDAERLPARLETLFLRRIDELDPAALRLCQTCCAFGPALSRERLQRIAPALGLDLAEGLDRLVESRILETDFSGQLRFTHQLVQEAGYRTLARRQRAELHAGLHAALLADAQATDGATGGRATHAELAHHAELAGLPEAALDHLRAACEEAIAIAAIETVHAIYRRAKRICRAMGPAGAARSARFALLAIDALQQLALEQEARDDMRALTDGTVDLGPEVAITARINLALLDWIDGAPRSARRHLAEAEAALAIRDSLPRRAYFELVSGYVDYALGNPRDALARFARLTETLRDGHAAATFGAVVVVPHVLALSFGAWYATDLGEKALAERWIAEASAVSETLEHNYSRLLARLARGYFLYRSGRLDEAIAILREGCALCLRNGFMGFEPAAVSWLALALIERGEADEAEALLSGSIARGSHQKVKTSATYYLFEARARLELARGRLASALSLAEAGRNHCRENEETLHEHFALVLREEVLARLAAASGRAAESAAEREPIRAELATQITALGLAPLHVQLQRLREGAG